MTIIMQYRELEYIHMRAPVNLYYVRHFIRQGFNRISVQNLWDLSPRSTLDVERSAEHGNSTICLDRREADNGDINPPKRTTCINYS